MENEKLNKIIRSVIIRLVIAVILFFCTLVFAILTQFSLAYIFSFIFLIISGILNTSVWNLWVTQEIRRGRK